ncbi:MAG: hypothetical protein HND55_05685 [Pseudomonadota bacterium]|nr:MAG: hypothetical protein HND55_05685 [Pseudomonadota bacterium]
MKTGLPVLGLAVILAAACSIPDLRHGERNVRLVDPTQTRHCQRLDTTQATLPVNAKPDNDPERLARLLADRARSSAYDIGGDTLVADGPIVEGSQMFIIYRCRSR